MGWHHPGLSEGVCGARRLLARLVLQKKIKLCFVCPKAYPLFNPEVKKVFGGGELDLYLLACELAKDPDYDIAFITADYGQAPAEVIHGVMVFNGLDFKKNPLVGARQLCQAMARADADIYMQETASLGTFLVAWYCQRHRKRFLYRTAHQDECDGSYAKKNWLPGKGFRWALRHASQVVVQNDQDRVQLEATWGLNSEVIRNGHVLPRIKEGGREFILWAGRSAAFKRPRLFFKLACEIPTEQFVMICPQATGDGDYDELKAEANAIANVRFIEGLPYEEMEHYFQRAKCYVNTSASEGFANTFVDACKAGTGILSLSVNPDRFLNRHSCGICADGNWGRLVEEVRNLGQDPAAITEIGGNARRYAEQYHDITRVAERYKAVFEKMMS